MKKIIFLILFIINNIYSQNYYFNLKSYKQGTEANNEMYYFFSIFNYSTFTVKCSDFKIRAYFFADDDYWTYDSYTSQGNIYDNNDNWYTTMTGSFTVTFYPMSDNTIDCGYYNGVSRKANKYFEARYNGSEILPPQYKFTTHGTNYFFRIRKPNWQNILGLKYNSYSYQYGDTSLPNNNPPNYGIDWKYIQLYFTPDNGNNWIFICERINTSGNIDSETGLLPCSTSACEIATNTFTNTPTNTITSITTFTPTLTNTFTPTITFTPTSTNTSTPTITFTPTLITNIIQKRKIKKYFLNFY